MLSTNSVLKRYRQLRSAGRKIQNELVGQLPQDALMASARRLGMVEAKAIVFTTEENVAFLVDHALYGYRRRGRSLFDQKMADADFDPTPEETAYLQAAMEARYSILVVGPVQRRPRTRVVDILYGEEFELVDEGLHRTSVPGLLLGARIVRPEGLAMTTGAPLPIGEHVISLIRERADKRFGPLSAPELSDISRSEKLELEAIIIRSAMEADVPYTIEHRDIPGLPDSEVTQEDRRRRLGRNDSCSCGSGRKFKKCCGALTRQ